MENKTSEKLTAYLYAGTAPSEEQKKRFEAFLKNKYDREISLEWKEDKDIKGFKLVYDREIYNWTPEGRFAQLKDKLSELSLRYASKSQPDQMITLLKKSIEDFELEAVAEEEGKVKTVGDGIVVVEGLDSVKYGEIVVFESGVKGMVQDLRRGEIGVILFGEDDEITDGSLVRRTKKTAGIAVGEGFIGRVVDALGNPVDNKGDIQAQDYRALETPAPSIIDRQPVNEPMDTGLISIDSMFPIGRGQRELIIGDRQTGKTTVALDTILNQKGNGVICIYVAIGQKASSVAQLVRTLSKYDALKYTIVVNASASEPAPLQYIAPYAGTAIGEYFMEQGKDVLIVYDDLSKHAIAYRALSLLLERSPGREAYPGDVFYLHSRLLERSAHLSAEKGGGSLTALPIVETQAGDVSAYIPTNIISITDGQIFLESELFFSGQRPAVNVGLSVSRVGGAAQTKAMKKAAGGVRLDLAQYREMEVFTQFSSDLDEATKKQLVYGQGLMRLLRQPQSHPMKLHEKVITLVAATAHVMQDVPLESMLDFRNKLFDYFHDNHMSLCNSIEDKCIFTDDEKQMIIDEAKKFCDEYLENIYNEDGE